MAHSKRDVVTVDSLKDQLFRTLLIIGKTGTGKSSLCNRIAGHAANSNIFPVSADAESCTQSTVLANVNFGGDKGRPVSLIDTMGFNDPNNDTDVKIITELVSKLKNKCDFVNLFGIAVNGQSPRLDGSLIEMIKIFEEMFGETFWKQCILVFTRMPMDSKAKRMRAKNTGGKSDDDIAKDYIKIVQSKFPNSSKLQYLFLDACFDEDDEDEEREFKRAMETLNGMLGAADKLQTSKVNENVQTDNYKLKEAIKHADKMHKEDTRRNQEKHQAEMRKNQEESERRRQEDKKESERMRQKDKEESERKRQEDARRTQEMHQAAMRRNQEESERRRQEDKKESERMRQKDKEESERKRQEGARRTQEMHQAAMRRNQEESERRRQEDKEKFESMRQKHEAEMRIIKEESEKKEKERGILATIGSGAAVLLTAGAAAIVAPIVAPVAAIVGPVAAVAAAAATNESYKKK